jgi:broad specificity phosphatase PhoE
MPKYQTHLKWAALFLVVFGIGAPRVFPAADNSSNRPSLIMIIRHGEKPEETGGEKDPNLTPQGYARAKALASVIPDHFPRPDFLFAAKRSKGSDRPVETITPLAKALDEPIDSKFKADDVEGLAHAVLTEAQYRGKVVLICWHHEKIPDLAKALGAKDAPENWSGKVFDQVWEITYDGDAASWKQVPENALPGDSSR